MSMALEAAFHAMVPAMDYAEGKISWDQAIRKNHCHASRAFGRRLRVAKLLHPVVSDGRGSKWVRRLGMTRFLPFGMLYHTLR